jgi:hypothetical protein
LSCDRFIHIYIFALQNANAYLLFYRRRTSAALGGKTHEKIRLARDKVEITPPQEEVVGLPTPPEEGSPPLLSRRDHFPLPDVEQEEDFFLPKPYSANTFDEIPSESNISLSLAAADFIGDSVMDDRVQFRGRPSPTSSNDVELDSDDSLSSPPSDNIMPPSPLVLQSTLTAKTSAMEADSWKSKSSGPEFTRLGQTEPHGDIDDIDL